MNLAAGFSRCFNVRLVAPYAWVSALGVRDNRQRKRIQSSGVRLPASRRISGSSRHEANCLIFCRAPVRLSGSKTRPVWQMGSIGTEGAGEALLPQGEYGDKWTCQPFR